MSIPTSEKVRTNALISYFFLGWIFLLARRNPDFSDPFVRAHAIDATRIHVGFLVAYLVYAYILRSFLYIPIPLVTVTVDKVVMVAMFSFLVYLIVRGPYLAYRGLLPERERLGGLGWAGLTGESTELSAASERDRTLVFLSFLPFVGYGIASAFPSRATSIGERVGNIFALLFIITLLSGGQATSLPLALLFGYILFLSFILVGLIVRGTVSLPETLGRIWSVDEVYLLVRAVCSYTIDIARVVTGRCESLHFRETLRSIIERDRAENAKLSEVFSDARMVLPDFLIFIPVVNLLFLPRLFTASKSRYVLAVPQGIIITILLLVLWVWLGFGSPAQVFLLFPIALGIGHVRHTPLYRIPLVYDLFALLDFLTFGVLHGSLRFLSKNSGEQTVSYRVSENLPEVSPSTRE